MMKEDAYLTPPTKAIIIVHNGQGYFDALCVTCAPLNEIYDTLLRFDIQLQDGNSVKESNKDNDSEKTWKLTEERRRSLMREWKTRKKRYIRRQEH